MTQGKLFTRSHDGQRRMLDELARLAETGERPHVIALAHTLGITHPTVRRTLLWLQAEGFARYTQTGQFSVIIELIRNPDDDELAAAIKAAGAR